MALWSIVFGVFIALICIASFIIAVIALMRTIQLKKDLDQWILDIKSRMSRLIKDINSVNELEYNVDVEQQNRINALTPK